MRGARTTPQTLQIWEASKNGLTPNAIAEKMGVSRCSVRTALTRGRKGGFVPPPEQASNLKHLLRAYNLRNGNVGEIYDSLTTEQSRWLIEAASKIECETVAEYLIELVRDEYEREKQND